MNSLQMFLIAAGFALISWASSEGIASRDYLPPVISVAQRKFVPSYYKPQYNQYQQQPYYPSYYPSYYHQYTNGLAGGYQQQALGQHVTTGTSLGLNGLVGYYPNFNLDLVTGIKPKVEVIDTVYDTNGGYIYGKKK